MPLTAHMLNQVLLRAKRRLLSHRLVATLALALSVFAGGLIPLLIAGTAIWNWWVPVVLGVASLIAGLIWLRASLPSEAAVAQLLDSRCALADTLATALHFRDSVSPIAEAQRRQANSAAEGIDCARVLPFQTPRASYPLAVLTVAVIVLFSIRYATESRLSLSAPLVKLPFLDAHSETAAGVNARKELAAKTKEGAMPPGVLTRLGTSTSDDPNEKDLASPPGTAVTNDAAKNGAEAGLSEDGKKSNGTGEQAANSGESGAAQPKQGAEPPPSTQDGSAQSAQAPGKNGGNADSSGLMSKLRDAVSGLLSKMKPEAKPPAPSNSPGTQQAKADQPSARQGKGGKPGQQDAAGNPSEQQGAESASDSDQMAPGKGAGKNSDQNASAKPGSGMGHGDGSKELKDAEQLNAMGKLSEIIGKRSATITGEMTIEPQGGPQQLRTGYTRSTARHGEATGDNNRDEVPLDMQPYIQQYFDQVHKEAAARAARWHRPPAT